MDKITDFRGPYRWLSNFEACPVEYEGIIYPTNEHAYQAAKSEDPEVRKTIAALPTPGKARRAGQKVVLRPGWDDMKIQVMFDINLKKFRNPVYMEKLLLTGDVHLEEGNTHGDRFWGTVGGEGRNELGKVLMRIRAMYAKGMLTALELLEKRVYSGAGKKSFEGDDPQVLVKIAESLGIPVKK